jgi:preprotein translocase SecE subunit
MQNQDAQNASTGRLPGVVDRAAQPFRRMRQFLHEVRVEMRQVTWPTRTAVRATTVVVLVTVAFFGVFFFFVDQGVSRSVRWILEQFGG